MIHTTATYATTDIRKGATIFTAFGMFRVLSDGKGGQTQVTAKQVRDGKVSSRMERINVDDIEFLRNIPADHFVIADPAPVCYDHHPMRDVAPVATVKPVHGTFRLQSYGSVAIVRPMF